MTVTFTPAPPHGTVGWGIPFSVASSFIGPLPSNTIWVMSVYQDAAHINPAFGDTFGTTVVTAQLFTPGTSFKGAFITNPYVLSSGDSAYVHMSLQAGFSILDSGDFTATWSSVDGLGFQQFVLFEQQWLHAGAASDVSSILAAVKAHYVNAP